MGASEYPPIGEEYKEITLSEGERNAQERGIVGYRIKQIKPGVYIKLAIVKERGKRGGKTVAVAKLKAI